MYVITKEQHKNFPIYPFGGFCPSPGSPFGGLIYLKHIHVHACPFVALRGSPFHTQDELCAGMLSSIEKTQGGPRGH